VRDALSAGVSGVAFGRNIWSHSDPALITRRLVDVVHPRGAAAIPGSASALLVGRAP
jgi:DhnA family fructose-bisphosphate aldolase class Ia